MKSILPLILLLFIEYALNAQNNNLIPIDISCVNYKSDRIIIKNNKEYESLNTSTSGYESCWNNTLPRIDFAEYVLIGINTSSEGCSLQIDEDFLEDPINQSCDIIISINVTGRCRRNNRIYFWRLAPKKTNMEYKIEILKYYK